MRHLPYPKIARTGAADVGGPWIATEKIHGAQLVVGTDGRATRIGKRKAWLAEDEPFFGWQLLRDRLIAAAATVGPVSTAYLYGELYGGAYPSRLVPPVPGVGAVQTGVWYSPRVRFALFDVLVDGWYLPYDGLSDIAAAGDLDVVPLLRRGRRHEAEAVATRFVTTVPRMLGLPELPDNFAEGVVVRADGRFAAGRRPIGKRKIAEFDERRFDESRPFDPAVRLTVAELSTVAPTMVNPPRLASARSKVGDEPAAVADEVLLDVLVDLADTFPAAMAGLDAAAEARLHTVIRAAVADLS